MSRFCCALLLGVWGGLALDAYAELQNVQVNGATYLNVEETAPHIGVIRGVLRDTNGVPVSGAIITLKEEPRPISDTGKAAGKSRNRVYEVPKGRSLLRLRTETAADGAFEFTDLPLSLFTFSTHTEDGRYEGTVTLSLSDPTLGKDIQLDPAFTIRGRVIDSAGRPAPGAHVHATQEMTRGESGDSQWSGSAISVEDGTFSIQGAPIATYTLCVSDSTFIAQYKRGVRADGKPVELVAHRLGRVRGIAVDDASGFPLYGITFTIDNRYGNYGQSWSLNPTDDDGRFEMDRLPPGVSTIRVQFDPREPRVWVLPEETIDIDVPEDGEAQATIRLRRGASVSGKVVDADSGEPVPSAHLSFSCITNSGTSSVDADDKGEYRIAGLRGGKLTLRYESAPDYPQGDGDNTVEVMLDYGQTGIAPNIRVQRGLPVSGQVIDQEGRPAASVEVTCEIRDGADLRYQTALSRADGSFRIFGLAQGDSVRVYGTRHRGDSNATDEVLTDFVGPLDVDGAGASGIALHAYPAGSISGVLLDSEQRPLSNTWIKAVYEGTPNLPYGGPDAKTDEAGRFSVKHLAEGAYTIEAYAERPIPLTNAPKVTVGRGQHVADLTILAAVPR
ncbi:MAG: carboxypeptidase regulatory-like domain-containing protein [Candidatus Hydrogenedentes bacterium]|nr:carboxypeptidase regulatory-like domain-containing protein [Candidatus Hydrogenedentota bacterium]